MPQERRIVIPCERTQIDNKTNLEAMAAAIGFKGLTSSGITKRALCEMLNLASDEKVDALAKLLDQLKIPYEIKTEFGKEPSVAPNGGSGDVILWQSKSPFSNETTRSFILNLGFNVIQPLSCGAYGCSLIASGATSFWRIRTKYVIKLGQIDEEEQREATAAAEQGIGPAVFYTGFTGRTLWNTRLQGKIAEGIIVMQPLDVTLAAKSKLTVCDADALIDLARYCVTVGFVHGDLNHGNIMIKSSTSRWYLIDFGTTSDKRDLMAALRQVPKQEAKKEWLEIVFTSLHGKGKIDDAMLNKFKQLIEQPVDETWIAKYKSNVDK
jgi:tRNA A-37 threonylcarbamoyl transferase component Bud32